MGRSCVGIVVALALGIGDARGAASGRDPALVFSRRCASCHTVGRGVRVGPDLEGVESRRDRDWLVAFIRSSETVIRSGDPVAVELFRQYRGERMPDHDLGREEIDALLAYVAAGGPAAAGPDGRSADTATPDEVERGRGLFSGRLPLASGGAACVSCHAVDELGVVRGGSLAPDLTHVYLRYRDGALAAFLRRPCFPRAPEATAAAPLDSGESFAIKAYLRHAALEEAGVPTTVKRKAVAPGLVSGGPGGPKSPEP